MDYFNLAERDLRRNPERKTYQIKNMWEQHHEIVRLALLGMKPADIARKLGFTSVMVSYTLNSPIVKEKLSIMRAARDADSIDIARDILELAPKAVELYEKLLEEGVNGTATSLHKSTADRVLEISGYGPVKRIQADHRHAHAHFTPEELENVKKQGREAAKEAGEMFVDAEFEEA